MGKNVIILKTADDGSHKFIVDLLKAHVGSAITYIDTEPDVEDDGENEWVCIS